ncbi:MAG: tRNA (guanosine(37)-N1)-methyltransferase TrmD [Arenicellales bacterium]
MTLNINVISIFPEMFDALNYGMASRAIDKQALALKLWNPRDYATNKHRTVDDRPYGGGPGMVMMAEPLCAAIDAATEVSQTDTVKAGPVIYLSPKGRRMTQNDVESLAALPNMSLIAGRYEGIDERIIESRVDDEISIGDYVLAGGEFAAMVLIEAVARLLPDVLGNDESAVQESFTSGMLDYPHYTRPVSFENMNVPEVLLSGNHQKIADWRAQQARQVTQARRPDLLEALKLKQNEPT